MSIEEGKAEVLTMLRNIDDDFQAHHSHPTKRIKIVVAKNGDSLVLEFGRDSQFSRDYWVFYPKYEHTRLNEIARISTSLLDQY